MTAGGSRRNRTLGIVRAGRYRCCPDARSAARCEQTPKPVTIRHPFFGWFFCQSLQTFFPFSQNSHRPVFRLFEPLLNPTAKVRVGAQHFVQVLGRSAPDQPLVNAGLVLLRKAS